MAAVGLFQAIKGPLLRAGRAYNAAAQSRPFAVGTVTTVVKTSAADLFAQTVSPPPPCHPPPPCIEQLGHTPRPPRRRRAAQATREPPLKRASPPADSPPGDGGPRLGRHRLAAPRAVLLLRLWLPRLLAACAVQCESACAAAPPGACCAATSSSSLQQQQFTAACWRRCFHGRLNRASRAHQQPAARKLTQSSALSPALKPLPQNLFVRWCSGITAVVGKRWNPTAKTLLDQGIHHPFCYFPGARCSCGGSSENMHAGAMFCCGRCCCARGSTTPSAQWQKKRMKLLATRMRRSQWCCTRLHATHSTAADMITNSRGGTHPTQPSTC